MELMEKILSRENMLSALKAVKQNKGAAGIDKVTVDELDEFGQWLRHKVRVVIIKQWKRPKTIYRNLMKLNRICKCNMSDKDIFKVANSRLGLYRRCSMNVVNYLLSPKVLEKANKKEGRPALVNPLTYYLG
jgi:hypothetical protein